MNQFLVIIRGAPASGKTTIAKKLRNFSQKIVWLKVDNFKDFFSDDSHPQEQKYVDQCALATLEYLLDHRFSVVMEKIFFDPEIILQAEQAAIKRGVSAKIFQIKCSLSVLQERDRIRPSIKEGCRKPLGDKLIRDIYNRLEATVLPAATLLDTEKLSVEGCVETIRKNVGF